MLPFVVLAALVAIGTVGCQQHKAKVTPTPADSLYQRIGAAKLKAVLSDTVDAAAADPKVNLERTGQPRTWNETPESIARFKQRLTQFIGAATGGPQTYQGADMVTAHKGMGITNAEFDAMAGHLKDAMKKHGVGAQEQQELLKVFEGTRQAVVQQPK
jgi:hemoglobin